MLGNRPLSFPSLGIAPGLFTLRLPDTEQALVSSIGRHEHRRSVEHTRYGYYLVEAEGPLPAGGIILSKAGTPLCSRRRERRNGGDSTSTRSRSITFPCTAPDFMRSN